jgi:hypothetical protein
MPEPRAGEWPPEDSYAGTDPDDVAAGPGAGTAADDEEARPPVFAPVRRLVSLGVVGLTALLTVAVVVGVQFDHGSFALVVLGVQILFVVVWTIAGQPPAPRVVGFVGLVVAGGADLAAVRVQPASLAPMAYITAGGFVVAVIGQLLRPAGRVRVTESLGSSLMVVLGVVAYATLIVRSRKALGTQLISACVVGAGTALLVAHLTDVVAPMLRVAPAVPRGGAGVIAGAMVGTAAAGLAGYLLEGLTTLPTAIAGLAAAVIALMVDLSVNYADAALSGVLDAERLRAMSETEALARLEKIRGVGTWTAAHILMRGCGLADADPVAEPRVLRGFASAYGLDHTATALEYSRASQRWRPFGMWVAVLLVRSIADSPAWRGRERRGR